MKFPKILVATAALALAIPGSALAAAPWSAPGRPSARQLAGRERRRRRLLGPDATRASLVRSAPIATPPAIAAASRSTTVRRHRRRPRTSAPAAAVVAVAAKDRIWAVPFDGSAFGAPEDVSGPEQEPHQPSVAFSGETSRTSAWQSTPTRVEIAQRPL